MRNKIFHSFRYEVIIYGLLSLFYAILTELGIFLIIKGVKTFLDHISDGSIQMNEELNNQVFYGTAVNNVNRIMDQPEVGNQHILLTVVVVIIAIILFVAYFLLLTKDFASYLDEIVVGINEISAGNFDTRIDIKNEDEFTLIASRINKMADDVKRIMENERKNEHVKNDLITSVAHDLRTPLTSIIGYLDLVSSGKELDDDTKNQYVTIAYNKSKRLEKLIEDLFTYTKFSTGEVSMHPCEVDMVKFMEQLVDEFYPSFQEVGLDYEFKSSHNQAIIIADGDLLARAIANLISNAVKYGRDGKSIKIEITKHIEHVVITVTNYGELIPDKDISNIFDRFYRVETSRSRETGGTGLGLAIAKNIIKMHGGSITAKSDFNGTVFEVILLNQLPGGQFNLDSVERRERQS
ncbi:HAMP domain-containing protein [Mobilisporobacter senegalensis]|uniref:histidine kinase n=1 Tax=Mobilisporobacter senegalensis TaxID=1329262 RepID=A0A3N1Y1U2_9FIRM|nr:HAMP domain-containing sensor histidine kinase [Mobilisporobacter senegalensis]ROR31492.1 HAMP domain-containing protein [Mobilisporobacter senegalensis]